LEPHLGDRCREHLTFNKQYV